MNICVWRISRVLAIGALVAVGTGAAADSNLPHGYPEPTCGERPEVPERPEQFETEEAVAAYNANVDAYNASMERLIACVRRYVAAAAVDIELIRRRAREAVDRMNP